MDTCSVFLLLRVYSDSTSCMCNEQLGVRTVCVNVHLNVHMDVVIIYLIASPLSVSFLSSLSFIFLEIHMPRCCTILTNAKNIVFACSICGLMYTVCFNP